MEPFKRNNNDDGNNGNNNGGGIVRRKTPAPIVEPRCNVCKHKHRDYIDQLLSMGIPFAELARVFEEDGISQKSLSRHKERHLSLETAAIRRILEEQSRALQSNIDNEAQSILTRRAVVDTAILKGHMEIVSGSSSVEPRDLVSFLAMAEKMEEKTSAMEKEEMMREWDAFQQAVKEVAPSEMFADIFARFTAIMDQKTYMDSYGIEVPMSGPLMPPEIDLPEDLRKQLEDLDDE
jgi:hypothetical protein